MILVVLLLFFYNDIHWIHNVLLVICIKNIPATWVTLSSKSTIVGTDMPYQNGVITIS